MSSLLLLAGIAIANALTSVQNFNVTQYLGVWYQVADDGWVQDTFQRQGYCVQATYGVLADGNLSVFNQERYGSPTGPVKNISGYAYVPNPAEPAQLKVDLYGAPVENANYWIIAVGPVVDDKYQWAVISEPGMTYMWVLTRNVVEYRVLYERKVYNLVKSLGFTGALNSYQPTSWDGCEPYSTTA